MTQQVDLAEKYAYRCGQLEATLQFLIEAIKNDWPLDTRMKLAERVLAEKETF